MTFKTEGQIYTSMKTKFEAIVGFVPGRIASAILRVCAAGIRLLYVVLEYLYWNIFVTYADREALRRDYEDWNMTWNNPTTENARKTVLNKYRQKGIGTKKWYEDAVTLNFPEVSHAGAVIGARGINTVDVEVIYHNRAVGDDTMGDIQAWFDNDDNKVCCVDVLVKTDETLEPL